MASDHEGVALPVGTDLWIPAIVTSVTNAGQVVVSTAYSSATLVVVGSDTHADKKPSNFPDLP